MTSRSDPFAVASGLYLRQRPEMDADYATFHVSILKHQPREFVSEPQGNPDSKVRNFRYYEFEALMSSKHRYIHRIFR